MICDRGEAGKCLSKATAMIFPDICRLTAKGIRITANYKKSKHSSVYDEMTT